MVMDFFSAAADPSQPILHNDRPQENASDDFAGAIAHRFGSGALLTARLTPSVATARPSPSAPFVSLPLSNSRSPALNQPPASLCFSNVIPQHVRLWSDDSTALILDIRPHVAYSAARVPSAVSLSVPSTLLKRPLFSLDRLAEMLPSAIARVRFSTWRSASRILVYDADSTHISGSSNIYGLLRKFKNDGFQGDLAWLQGGFQAIWRERRDLIDTNPPTPDAENEDEDEDAQKLSLVQSQPVVLRTRHLPLDAFSNSSSTVNGSSSINPCNPMPGALVPGAIFSNPTQPMSQPAYNPFFDAVRQNIELSQGITERIPLRLPKRVRNRIHDLPFPWLREIASRAAKPISHNRSTIDSSEESEDDENITSADIEEGKETLAMQFFKIEVAEQRRLMGIMEHHTKETVIVTSETNTTISSFPYSITAGVEKGAKNRYRNIWPFEHARVRLHQRREADDDYVNASYVQPLGSNKRYIATQGPLPATFTDFWTLCWEQNVHVIVMLTREVENSMTKCGSYWTESTYGPLRLRLISTTGTLPPQEEDPLFLSASYQHMTSLPSKLHQQYSKSSHRTCKNAIIRRVFELTHSDYSEAPIRKIIHLQYLEWPDMNVPDDCRGILELIKEVDNATNETLGFEEKSSNTSAFGETKSTTVEKYGVSEQALIGTWPILLHCSAGVGRTGGFIAIDAVLDAVRAELMSKRGSTEHAKNEDMCMDVDVPIPISVSSVTSEKHPSASSRELTASIIAGNGFEGLKQDLEGTGPEGSESERENHFKNCMTSTTAASMSTRAWAEDVSHHDYGTCNMSEHQNQPKTFESGPHLPSSSRKNLQPTIPSDSSSSSGHSLLDISGSNGHSDTIAANGHYLFPQSSSFTSVATVASPEDSPPKNESSPNSKQDPQTETSSVLADHVPVQSASVQLKKSVDGGLRACARLESSNEKNRSVPHLPSGGYLRNRSPSPMARTTSDESATSVQKHCAKPPSNLRVPSFSFSSDAEPPSRSVSPSADEGSVASQVSSYDSLKYRKSLPVRATRSDQRENVHNPRLASVPERLNSPVISQVASSAGPSAGHGLAAADLKPPRPLHGMVTPPPLSSFDNPIYEIIQDMRKQRMSLCQSLRQYIFVHAAILEGALMIVDEERQREEKRKRAGETGGFKRGSERWGEAEGLKVLTPINESSNGFGNVTTTEEPSRPYVDSNEVLTAAAISASTSTLNTSFIPSRVIQDEGGGYFSSLVSQPPLTSGLTADENVDERALESVFSPRPRPQARTFSSLQRHALLDVHFDRKRNNSPSNHIGDDITDLGNNGFRRPSVKRKQPTGDAGETAMRKRAQNESLSREREREKEQRRAEGKMNNGTYARPRDGAIDILASGIVR